MTNKKLKQLVIVCGMHRSGTSTITKSLEALGVNLGNNLLNPMIGVNDKGFFEDWDFHNINEDILHRFNNIWHSLVQIPKHHLLSDEMLKLKEKAKELLFSRINKYSIYGVKDPRFSVLLPFWQNIFSELNIRVSYVIPCRDPLSVALSLQKRDGFALIKGFYLWLQHVLLSIKHTENQELIVVDYNKVIDSPIKEIERLSNFLKTGLVLDLQKLEDYQKNFLDPSLQHARFSNEEIISNSEIPDVVKKLYELLLNLANDRLNPKDISLNNDFINIIKEANNLLPFFEINEALEKQQRINLNTINHNHEEIKNLSLENHCLKEKINNLSQEIHRNESNIKILLEQKDKQLNEISLLDSSLIEANVLNEHLQNEIKHRDDFISHLDQLRIKKEQELESLTTSRSWKITKPLRFISEEIRSHTKKSQVEFMFIAESGIIEYQALLLAESIRNFGGKYSESKITVISPRNDRRPLKSSIDRLKSLGVDYLPLNINSLCPDYGTSYRVLASAYFEKKSKSKVLIVLDSDTLFIKEPELELEDNDVGLRPVDVKGMCTTGHYNDPMNDYWHKLCKCCGVEFESIPMTTSTVDKVVVKASYNGGFIVAKRSAKVFSKTKDYFIKSINAGLLPYSGTSLQILAGHGLVSSIGSQYWGSSQACLSLAITKKKLKVKILPSSHNFPASSFEHLKSQSEESIKEICHLHYHHLLAKPQGLNSINNQIELLPANFREWLLQRYNQLDLANQKYTTFG